MTVFIISDGLKLPSFVESIKVAGVRVPRKKVSAGNLTFAKVDFDSLNGNEWLNDQVSFSFNN